MFKKFLVFLCVAVFALVSLDGCCCSKKNQNTTEQTSISDSTTVAPDSSNIGAAVQVPDTTKSK